MQTRSVTTRVGLCLAAFVVGVGGIVGTAHASLPPTANEVTVTSEHFTTGTDAHLHAAGSISGTIARAGGGTGLSARVQFWSGGKIRQSTDSDATGHYQATGLPPGTYAVCVAGDEVSLDTATGFLGGCSTGDAFPGNSPPITAYTTLLSEGDTVANVDVAMSNAAAISGIVTSPSGAGVGAVVTAYNRSTGARFSASSRRRTGAYNVSGLTASATGYTICFAPFTAGNGTGFLPRCFLNHAWDGGAVPSDAQAVSVAVGQVHGGVNQALPRGGAIAGTVRNASDKPLKNVKVWVFTASGKRLTYRTTDTQGHYVIPGLVASTGYRVCVGPFGASASVVYDGTCWLGIAWSGRGFLSAANKVDVHLGATHSGINFILGGTVYQLGSIAGTIHETYSSGVLTAADVYLFSKSDAQLQHTTTDLTGRYSFSHVRPSASAYVICVSADSAGSILVPAWGWESRCYGNALWNGITVPDAATRVSLTSGQTRTGIDISLNAGGGISGNVYDGAGTLNPLQASVKVIAFTLGGRQADVDDSSAGSGSYTLDGLNPGNYIVCFDGRFSVGDSPTGYVPQCFDKVVWEPRA